MHTIFSLRTTSIRFVTFVLVTISANVRPVPASRSVLYYDFGMDLDLEPMSAIEK